MEDTIINVAVTFAGAILAGLGLLSGLLLKIKTGSEYWTGVISRTKVAVDVAVRSVFQSYVDSIKASNADGKLTDEEKAAALSRAKEVAKSYLGAKGLGELVKVFGGGSVDAVLEAEIEARVGEVKAEAPLEPSPAA